MAQDDWIGGRIFVNRQQSGGYETVHEINGGSYPIDYQRTKKAAIENARNMAQDRKARLYFADGVAK